MIRLLPDMAVFVKVVERGSFTGAARELGMTASATSRQVTRLEKALRLRLLERTTRKLRLSESGAEVFQYGQEMLQYAHQAADVAERFMQAPHGRVRVGVSRAFGRLVIHPLVVSFLRRYPDVDVELLVADRDIDLIDDHVDIVIRITDAPPEGLVARPLATVNQVVCASPDYLRRRGAPAHPAELADHDCLYLGERAGDHRWHFRRAPENAGVTVRGRYIVNHSEMRLDAIIAGLGIGCLPFFAAREPLLRGELIRVLADWEVIGPGQGTAFALHAPTRFLAPKFRVFIDHLVSGLSVAPTGVRASRREPPCSCSGCEATPDTAPTDPDGAGPPPQTSCASAPT